MSTALPTTLAEPHLPVFEQALADGDAGAAVAIVEDLLAAGVPATAVLLEVVGEAQRRIGERWQRGEWSVAQEHTATGVSMAAVEAVARHTRALPATRGRIVLGCAEREWHALPAMVVGTVLRERGWEVTFLGASTPADRLSSFLQDVGPDATAVSCSIVGALPSTRQFIEASTGAGIPVVAGGAAFGADDRRARALGATAWAPRLPHAVDVFDTLPAVVPPAPPLPAERLAEQRALELVHRRLADEVAARWAVACAESRDCVEQALWALQGALLTGDGRLVAETAEWVTALLAARGVAGAELGSELTAVLRDFPLAVGLLHAHWPGARP
jgi:methanogenic corrinoid protein MtbC1